MYCKYFCTSRIGLHLGYKKLFQNCGKKGQQLLRLETPGLSGKFVLPPHKHSKRRNPRLKNTNIPSVMENNRSMRAKCRSWRQLHLHALEDVLTNTPHSSKSVPAYTKLLFVFGITPGCPCLTTFSKEITLDKYHDTENERCTFGKIKESNIPHPPAVRTHTNTRHEKKQNLNLEGTQSIIYIFCRSKCPTKTHTVVEISPHVRQIVKCSAVCIRCTLYHSKRRTYTDVIFDVDCTFGT